MASTVDTKLGYELLQTPGWQTLMTILRETGEHHCDTPLRKRAGGGGEGVALPDAGNERLAKRLRNVSLIESKTSF